MGAEEPNVELLELLKPPLLVCPNVGLPEVPNPPNELEEFERPNAVGDGAVLNPVDVEAAPNPVDASGVPKPLWT